MTAVTPCFLKISTKHRLEIENLVTGFNYNEWHERSTSVGVGVTNEQEIGVFS